MVVYHETDNNVLNVIDTEEARGNVIRQAAKALKEGGTAYFTVYEGDGSGEGRQTTFVFRRLLQKQIVKATI